MAEHKICRQCQAEFEVTDADLGFYKKIKAKWREDTGEKYHEDYYEPKDIGCYQLSKNPDAENEIARCLSGVLKCEESGKPFKIMAPELAQYIERNIQLPRQHPNIRYKHRLELLNKMKLYDRQCMCEQAEHGHSGGCTVRFKTTFAPDRPESVYCEECYQKTVL